MWREVAVLRRVIYKNKNQHRSAHYLTKLEEVGAHRTSVAVLNK